MQRKPIKCDLEKYPEIFHRLIRHADIYDSSSSRGASVIFIDTGCGYYLKSAAKGSLKKEAEMTEYFNKIGLGAGVISYLSDERDWLLCERVRGEDATYGLYLDDPKRLCDTLAEAMLTLHEKDPFGSPEEDRTKAYFEAVQRGFSQGKYDTALGDGYPKTAIEAIRLIDEGKALLKSDTLIHGDFCLPNVMLDGWRLSGFIDLGGGGVGDRHIDLFWCAWSLRYNLGTDKFRDRLFDAYGRERIDTDALRIVELAEAFG